MYILAREGFGNAPTTLAMRKRPHLKLDRFRFDDSRLTYDLQDGVRKFAGTVIRSWNTAHPMETIRLVGHTDSTGSETYNVGLGDRRAQSVAVALHKELAGLKGRVTIVVDKSPGETDPTADNRTAEGQALNRRVEVWVQTRVPPPPSPSDPRESIDLWHVKPPPEPVIVTHPSDLERGIREPIPTRRPGQSFKGWLDDILSDHHVPKLARDGIWKAIFDKDWGGLSSLLGATGIGGGLKDAIVESARAAAEGKAR